MICVLARMNISIIFILMITMFIAVKGESRLISAHRQPDYDNKYEVKNAIAVYYDVRFVECSVKCISDTRCLSLFYNNLTRACILHSDPFTYSVMSLSEKGWKFYLSQERCGRCLVNFYYYRELHLCYKLEPPTQASNIGEDSVCPGSEIMRIDSDERQDYIKLVTADIGEVYFHGICIQGKLVRGKWTYNDGSTMKYFRWENNKEPIGYCEVITMIRRSKYVWRRQTLSKTCTYMCEYRSLNSSC